MESGDQEVSSMKLQTLQLLPEEQIVTLRQQMVESQASYQRKLQSSQEAQHRQAVLVQKLQAKVLQYRSWCRELQQRLETERGGPLSHRWEAKEEHSLERALVQLEEEQQRCENLAEVNTLLRENLGKANEVNTALREDVRKLTVDWTRARDELELKETEWRTEREFFDGYLSCEHDRLLSLWRQVVTFRRHFLEMKTATDRDLSALKADQIRLSGSILVSCFHLSSGTRHWESNTLERSTTRDQTQQLCARAQELEKEVYQKTQEVMCLQVKGNIEKEELQGRVMELSALLVQSQKQNEEKEMTVKTLSDTMEILEASRAAVEYKASLTKNAKEETLSLHQVIKDITQAVLDDTDNAVNISWAESSQHPESSALSSLLSSSDMEGALVLVHEALSRRCRAVQALREQLSASQNAVHSLQHQQRQQEEECKMLRQRLQQLEENCKTLTSQTQHLQSLVETLSSDRVNLEKAREELQQQLEVSEQEAWRLRRSNTELQLKEDLSQGEKEEQQLEMERILRERERLQKALAALEAKHSLLKSELVARREALEKSHLDGELMKQEKHELAMALERAEQSIAELTSAQNKLKTETADLHDVAEKMSGINEALALDKMQLNQLVLQLEQENQALSSKVKDMQRATTSVQEDLSLSERANEELCAEKTHLEQLLQKAKEVQEGLQAELSVLRDERKETHEVMSQMCRQEELSSTDLEKTRLESSRRGDALAKVSKEKEALVREKAALEVRLGAVERDRRGLSEQLAELRSAKEILESSLFEAQQQVSQLEVTRGQLEINVQTVTQAKEVIQGEVKCLRCELETERSTMEQEREDMAQQLSRTEQQYQDTLSLRQAAYEEEMNKLLQELKSEQDWHCAELKEVSELSAQEKAEAEGAYEKKLLELRQEAATMQSQKEEERARAENARQEFPVWPVWQAAGDHAELISRGDHDGVPKSQKSFSMEVRDLIAVWGEESVLSELHSSFQNAKTFVKISQGMKDRGHNRDPKQCRVKLKELRQAYQKTREANGRSGSEPQTCRFYDELHAILRGSATTTPAVLFDSFNGDEGNTEAGFGDEEDDEEEAVDSSQQTSEETGFPDSQELFLTLDLEPVPPEHTQGCLPDPPGGEGTSAACISRFTGSSPSQRLAKTRRRKKRTHDEMFSELMLSSHTDRAQTNA